MGRTGWRRMAWWCVPMVLAMTARPAQAQRELIFETVIPVDIQTAFDMWIEPDQASRFLAHEVRIDPWVGGRYEALFDPDTDPAGARAGTYNSKVLSIRRPQEISFEWESLTPMPAAQTLGGRRVLQRSVVQVRFTPRGADSTLVHIRHHGIGEGPDWDASLEFYRERGWPWILARLEALFATSG
jgi:uncharacterized protein YndB with AHSA1/START domain